MVCIVRTLLAPAAAQNLALCLGNFDGVHLGHQALLQHAQTQAPTVGVLTLQPHPRQFFAPHTPPFLLNTAREQWQLLQQYGAQVIFALPFARLHTHSAAQFEQYLWRLQPHSLHIGADFCYGVGRKGNASCLRAAGFNTHILPSVTTANGVRVSSQSIRQALQQGDITQVQRLLGRSYSIYGRVIHGQHLARTLGYATANIRWRHRIAPRLGVYAVRVQLPNGTWHNGVANIGRRPSVDAGTHIMCEVHVLNGQHALYGQAMTVQLQHFIRDEQRFANLGALQQQIAHDVAHAQHLLNTMVLG